MTDVTFPGPGPFHLPAAQYAKVSAGTDAVTVTLYAVIEEQGSDPQPISFQIVPAQAHRLATALIAAANAVEQQSS
jgi:predicted secreted protein